MYEMIRRLALLLLKVPPEPHPPFGDPNSLRVFNADRNYFRLRMARWTIVQLFALAGFIFWTTLLLDTEATARKQKEAQGHRAAATNTAELSTSDLAVGSTPGHGKRRRTDWSTRAGENIGKATVEWTQPEVAAGGARPQKKRLRLHGWAGFKQMFVEVALVLPSGAFPLIWAIKILSFLIYLAQIPLTYALRRLDFEMRWYMVTDRSLRLRHGVWRVSEATMSFANIQQVLVSQGPLQRLLGLADVKVQSAGGGGGHYDHKSADMHIGLFHCVTNAPEIRDLILERLRRFREAGLGDPEDKTHPVPAAAGESGAVPGEVLAAARELATQARALRVVVSRPQ